MTTKLFVFLTSVWFPIVLGASLGLEIQFHKTWILKLEIKLFVNHLKVFLQSETVMGISLHSLSAKPDRMPMTSDKNWAALRHREKTPYKKN